MNYKKVLFCVLSICGLGGGSHGAGLLRAEKFPGTFQDLSFQTRLDVLTEGYDELETEYDEYGRCISGCAYQGITLAEAEALSARAAQELQQVLAQEQAKSGTGVIIVTPETPTTQTAPTKPETPTTQTTPTKPGTPTTRTQPVQPVDYFASPLKRSLVVTSDYGERRAPKTSRGKGSSYHNGIDLRASKGTPVYAPADGKVVKAGNAGNSGNLIHLEHSFGVTDKKVKTVYAHLDRIDVKKGVTVKKGQQIGTAGNTGNSGGDHLHYEFRFNEIKIDPLGAYEKPITDQQKDIATSSMGTNLLGKQYCFKNGISSTRLQPYKGNSSAIKDKFPQCSGWCD